MLSASLSVCPSLITAITWEGNKLGSPYLLCRYLSWETCLGLYMVHLDPHSRSQRSTLWISSYKLYYRNNSRRRWARITKFAVYIPLESHWKPAWDRIWVSLTVFQGHASVNFITWEGDELGWPNLVYTNLSPGSHMSEGYWGHWHFFQYYL